MSLYYEKYIHSDKISTKSLIKLSELQRTFDKAPSEAYHVALKQLCQNIRYNRIPIHEHPEFEFKGYTSTAWPFELIRVAATLKETLEARVEGEDDLKVKNKLLLEAIKLSNECTKHAASLLFHKPENKAFKYLNPRYHLSNTLSLAAQRFYNMYLFKPNAAAAKKAFQLKELAGVLWDANNDHTLYRAKALLEMAKQIDDDMQFGEKVALLEPVVLQDDCPEEVTCAYETWKQQNEQVYFRSVYTDKTLEVISLEDAFQVLTKLLESHQ